MNDRDKKRLKRDYKKGLSHKELCKMYNITHNQLIVFLRKNQLTRSKSEIAKGNQNAVGNKGGAPPNNKNAVTTGVYENITQDFLDDDEKLIYENCMTDINVKQKIKQKLAYLEVRERRIFKRIEKINSTGKDMTVASLSSAKNKFSNNLIPDTSTNTVLEPVHDVIQRLENGLTKVQDTERKYLDLFSKIKDEPEKGDDRVQIINDLPRDDEDGAN